MYRIQPFVLVWFVSAFLPQARLDAQDCDDFFRGFRINNEAIESFDVLLRVSSVDAPPSSFEDTFIAIRIMCDVRTEQLVQLELGVRKITVGDQPPRTQRSEGVRIANGNSTQLFELADGWTSGKLGVGSLAVLDLRAFGLSPDTDTKMKSFEFNRELFSVYEELARLSTNKSIREDKIRFDIQTAPEVADENTKVGHSLTYEFDRKRMVPSKISVIRNVDSESHGHQNIPICRAHYEWLEDKSGIMIPKSLFLSRRRIARDQNNSPLAAYQAKQDIEFKWLAVNETIDERFFDSAYWKEDKSRILNALSDEFLRTQEIHTETGD